MSKTNRSVGDISGLDVFFWDAKCPALHFGGNRQGNTEIWPRSIFSTFLTQNTTLCSERIIEVKCMAAQEFK
jgi:primase-polymerase (primpol)-like protein